MSTTSPSYELLEDSDLISIYQEYNDNRALEALISRYKDKLYLNVFFIVKKREIAEDLFQECIIKVIEFLKERKYEDVGKFSSWVARIARNLAVDHARRHTKYINVPIEENVRLESYDQTEDLFEDQLKQNTVNRLHKSIRRLPDSQREVLIMRHYMHMSFHEIAKATHVSINTAIGRMRYALINLKKEFEKKHTNYETRAVSYHSY